MYQRHNDIIMTCTFQRPLLAIYQTFVLRCPQNEDNMHSCPYLISPVHLLGQQNGFIQSHSGCNTYVFSVLSLREFGQHHIQQTWIWHPWSILLTLLKALAGSFMIRVASKCPCTNLTLGQYRGTRHVFRHVSVSTSGRVNVLDIQSTHCGHCPPEHLKTEVISIKKIILVYFDKWH